VIEALLAAAFGLLIGSFLNVCIYRLPRDLSVVAPRSFCPSCERQIAWYDNVPLLSFALLRGKCRYCGASIPARYPLVEALTALLFFIAVRQFGLGLAGVKFCVFAALMLGLIFADLEERILPDEFTLGGTLIGLGFALWLPVPSGPLLDTFLPESWNWRLLSLAEAAFAASAIALVLWSIGALYFVLRKKEGLGLGDVKMIACIGSFLGTGGTLLTLMLGSVLGSITGIAFIVLQKKDAGTYELPFGTFLGLAAISVALFRLSFVL
jgi:leader peptidase (prepilin peptidase)/N-methyltransferase